MIQIKLFKTLVKIRPDYFVNVVGLWAIATVIGLRQHPERPLLVGIFIGFSAMFLFMFADFGHSVAHIFSARRANAPMDEILVTSGMPRTIYFDNDVSPETHRKRSFGGPIFSAVCLLLSLTLYFTFPMGSIIHELAGWSTIGHAFIFFGAMSPLPVVDGGVIYKWTMVIHGKSEAEADAILRKANWVLGGICILASIVLLILKSWIIAAVVLVTGLIPIYFVARRTEKSGI
ncbi:MAG: hypothetical protein ACK2T7_12925 [Anaerolineales bacterium]